MTSLATAVIGEHFLLFDKGDGLGDDETLSPDATKMNGRMGNHLIGLLFIENVSKEAGGFE